MKKLLMFVLSLFIAVNTLGDGQKPVPTPQNPIQFRTQTEYDNWFKSAPKVTFKNNTKYKGIRDRDAWNSLTLKTESTWNGQKFYHEFHFDENNVSEVPRMFSDGSTLSNTIMFYHTPSPQEAKAFSLQGTKTFNANDAVVQIDDADLKPSPLIINKTNKLLHLAIDNMTDTDLFWLPILDEKDKEYSAVTLGQNIWIKDEKTNEELKIPYAGQSTDYIILDAAGKLNYSFKE